MTKIRTKNYGLRPKFDVGDILELVGCKMSSRKLIKLNWTPESIPTAWGLIFQLWPYFILLIIWYGTKIMFTKTRKVQRIILKILCLFPKWRFRGISIRLADNNLFSIIGFRSHFSLYLFLWVYVMMIGLWNFVV